MKKLLLIITVILTSVSAAWADELPNAIVGTYAFLDNTLTTGADGNDITKDANGNVTITKNSGQYGSNLNRFWGTIVIKINVPLNPTAGYLCHICKSGSDKTASQGLWMDANRTLKTSWGDTSTGNISSRTSTGNPVLTAGEHTIIYATGNYSGDNGGAKVYVDGVYKFTDAGLCAWNITYKAICIPSTFAQYITEIYFIAYTGMPDDKASSIHNECSNYIHSSSHKSTTDVSGKTLVIDEDANLSNFNNESNIYIAAGKTLKLDKDGSMISLIGNGTALQESNITTTVTGNLPSLTLKSTAGTLNYNGNILDGTTLDRVVLNSSSDRITTSGDVNIKNLAGCNLPNNGDTNYHYAFIGSSGTINFYGTCDLTKKSDGTPSSSFNLGYASGSNIVIKENASVTIGVAVNTVNSNDNASITVESNATLTTIGSDHADCVIYTTDLTNNGEIIIANGQWHLEGISKIHSTLSGSGTLKILEGTTLNVSSIPSSMTLAGRGNVTLTTFPTSTAPTISNWTGTIEFPDGGSSSTNLTNIFNAWGNSNSTIKINNVQGYFLNNNNNITNPTLDILNGKTLTLNNGSSGADAYLSKVTGAGTIDRQGWSSSNNHNLYITRLTNFTGTLKGSGHPIIVENLVLTGVSEQQIPIDDNLLFKTLNTVYFSKTDYDSKIFINNEEKTAVYAWEKRNNSTEGYYVSEYAPTKINNAIRAFNTYQEQYNIGTGVGKYSVSLGDEKYTNYSDFEETVSAMGTLAAWEGKTVSIAINQPTTGYYYIKSKYNESTGYYLSCENKSNSDDTYALQTTTTDEKNIFYIEVGNTNSTILSYSTGYYFGNNTRANYTSVTDNPVKWTFSEGNNKGTYQLTSDWSDGSKILYGWSGRENEAKADRNGAATTDGHTDWILIPVPAFKDKTSTEAKPAILGNITSTSDVINNITADAKFVDLSQATIGTSIDNIKAAVNGINPNAIIIAPQGTDVNEDNTSNVLVKTNTAGTYKCENLQLNDDVIAQFTSETNFTNTKVTYSRTATESQWGTIYLPYDPEVEEGVTYYELTASDENSLTFTKVDNPEANTPYMYKKTTAGDMSVTNTSTSATFALGGDTSPHVGSGVNNYHLVGILTNSSIVESEGTEAKAGYNQIVDSNAYYFKNTDHKFYSLNQRFNMKAFRCYLTTTNNSARQDVLGFSYEENGEPTGVSFIESEDGNTVDVIFDLNGRRLQNAKKGINIINGKKVIK